MDMQKFLGFEAMDVSEMHDVAQPVIIFQESEQRVYAYCENSADNADYLDRYIAGLNGQLEDTDMKRYSEAEFRARFGNKYMQTFRPYNLDTDSLYRSRRNAFLRRINA